MTKKIISIAFLLISMPLFAECPPVEEKTGPWKSSVNLTYNKTSGNSDVSLLNAGFLSNYEENSNLLRFQLDHSFGETENKDTGEKETNVDYSLASTEYKRVVSERFYAGLGTDVMRNEIADVKYRAFLNPKIGYFIFKEEGKGSLDLFVGPSYLWEEVGGIKDHYLAPRIGDRLEYQISETAKIFQNLDLFLSTEDGDNYLVQGEAGIETKISGSLNLVFKVRDLYDNQPAAGNKKNDLALLSGFSLDL